MPNNSDHRTIEAGTAFQRLVDLMETLRSTRGCAWDREQTLQSLRPFVLEETYEVIDAIDRGDLDALRDELGDFLLEAVFIAQICKENDDFNIRDSLKAICEKLVRRHPHVFEHNEPGGSTMSATDVKRQWEKVKASEQTERGRPPRLLSGIPDALPSLLRAYRLGRRAATVGFDWPNVSGADAKVREELDELEQARKNGTTKLVEEEIGDLLFAVANLARHLEIDPETALRAANRKFSERFAALEERFEQNDIALRDASPKEMDTEWQRVKEIAKDGG